MHSFHFIVAVWGAVYTDLLLNVAVPSLLSPGNLGACRGRRERCVFKIVTTPPDAEVILAHPISRKLQESLELEIVRIEGADLDDKWGSMVAFHRRAIADASREDAGLSFVSPDAVYGEGSYANIMDAAASGKRAILVTGLRVARETFLPWYRDRHRPDENGVTSITCRDLVKATCEHLHPWHTWTMWNSDTFSGFPSALYFPVLGKGLVARCFHLHPAMVVPRDRAALPMGTVDDDYVNRAGLVQSDFHYLTDSDLAFGCDLAPRDSVPPPPRRRASVHRVAGWAARSNITASHRVNLRQRMLIHYEDVADDWRAALDESDAVVEAVIQQLESKGLARLFNAVRWLALDWRRHARRFAVLLFGETRVAAVRAWQRGAQRGAKRDATLRG